MPSLHARRAGLTLNPLVFLLLLALIAVFVWRGFVILDILNQTAPQLGKGVKSGGVILGCVIGGLLVCALAGGLGLLLYFVCGRSEGAANGGIGLVLLLGVGWIGYGTYVTATTPLPPQATAGGGGRSGTGGVNSLRGQMDAMAEQQRQAMERARQVNEANRQAAIDQMNRTREAARNAAQQRPGTVPPSPGPPASPLPPGSTPASGTTPPAPAAPPVEDPVVAQKAKAALDPLRDEIAAKVTEFLSTATPLVTALDKSPKATRSELDAREKACTDLKQKSTELEAYFRSIDERAGNALKGAGLDHGDQVRQRIAFGRSVDGFAKANACNPYQRLFDAGLEEAQELKESAGKWRYDAGGQITSTDIGLQSRLRHLRKGVTQQKNGIASAESTLKQKPSEPTR